MLVGRVSKIGWILGALALFLPPLVLTLLSRSTPFASGWADRPLGGGLRCVGIRPASFSVAPGAQQLLAADLSIGRGRLVFSWKADGGTFASLFDVAHPKRAGLAAASHSEMAALNGYAITDDFAAGRIGEPEWRIIAEGGRTVRGWHGMLALGVPGGLAGEQTAAVESTSILNPPFAVEVMVHSLTVRNNRGSAALLFMSDDGHAARIAWVRGAELDMLEASTRTPDGVWQKPFEARFPGEPVRLQIIHWGDEVGFRFHAGADFVEMGEVRTFSKSPGRIVLRVSSADTSPEVSARFDNLGMARNILVMWRAPSDAEAGSVHRIRFDDRCEALARVEKD